MRNLMKLELKKYPIKNILIFFYGCTSIVLLFTYFFSFVSKMRPEEASQNQSLLSYDFVLNMTYLMSIVTFSMLSTFIFSKIILEDYKGDNLFILFTYPIKRTKHFISKIVLCLMLVIFLVTLGQLSIVITYFLTESFLPIMTETSLQEINIVHVLQNIISVTFQSIIIAILSFTISFKSKSTVLSLSLSVLISAILCNLSTIGNPLFTFLTLLILSIISVFSILYVMRQIKAMSIEGNH